MEEGPVHFEEAELRQLERVRRRQLLLVLGLAALGAWPLLRLHQLVRLAAVEAVLAVELVEQEHAYQWEGERPERLAEGRGPHCRRLEQPGHQRKVAVADSCRRRQAVVEAGNLDIHPDNLLPVAVVDLGIQRDIRLVQEVLGEDSLGDLRIRVAGDMTGAFPAVWGVGLRNPVGRGP